MNETRRLLGHDLPGLAYRTQAALPAAVEYAATENGADFTGWGRPR